MEKTSDSLMLRLLLFCTKIWESVGYKVSDNSLSNSTKETEKETGITIFRRSRTGITLTQKGTEFLGYAR